MLSLHTNYVGNLPILAKAWKKAIHGLKQPLNYPSTLGYEPLREKIAELYSVDQSQVLMTTSATEALHLIAQVEKIYIPKPAFFGALRQQNFSRSEASAVYINSIQHSVTSKTLKASTIYAIKDEWETQIFDNPYSLLVGRKQRTKHTGTFTIGSFSKVFGPGLRLGYIIADARNISRLKSIHISASLSCPQTTQELVYKMLPILPELRAIRKAQLQEGTQWLRSLGFKTPDPRGGLHTSITVKKDSIPETLLPYLQSSKYCEEENSTNTFIPINVSAENRRKLKHSLEKLTPLL